MKAHEIESQLSKISSPKNLISESQELVDLWTEQLIGKEVIDPILRFMEEHPLWDFGMPGPLVHLVEKYYGDGYEVKLLESISRRPTAHTVWMLNRIINGQKDPIKKKFYLDQLNIARNNPLIDEVAIQRVDHFLALH